MPATTQYIGGGLFEAILGSSGATYKNYIVAPTGVVAIVTQSSSTADKLEYLHRDNLGSISVITDPNRAILERINFDAFGKRVAVVPGLPGFETTRGYTGHLQLDALNLVHMNGRVYDPVIGRFLSPDPIIQAPDNTQSYNRYSYVWNNPLTFTDPSGYSLFGSIGHFFKQNWRALAAVAITAVAVVTAQAELESVALGIYSTAGAYGIAAAGGFAAGYVASNGSLTAGLIGAATAVAFFGIGQAFSAAEAGTSGSQFIQLEVERVVAHGVVGGLSSVAQRGNFGLGFLAAAVPVAVPTPSNPFAAIAEAAAVGGTVSEIGGGKFANGAVTAAFSYGFNDVLDGLKEAYRREIHARLTSGIEKKLFDRYLDGNGDYTMEESEFRQAADAAGTLGPGQAVTTGGGTYDAHTVSYYGNPDLDQAYGTATVYTNDGVIVGFRDTYNFDPKPWGVRPFSAEVQTRLVNRTATSFGAKDYKICYGVGC